MVQQTTSQIGAGFLFLIKVIAASKKMPHQASECREVTPVLIFPTDKN